MIFFFSGKETWKRNSLYERKNKRQSKIERRTLGLSIYIKFFFFPGFFAFASTEEFFGYPGCAVCSDRNVNIVQGISVCNKKKENNVRVWVMFERLRDGYCLIIEEDLFQICCVQTVMAQKQHICNSVFIVTVTSRLLPQFAKFIQTVNVVENGEKK